MNRVECWFEEEVNEYVMVAHIPNMEKIVVTGETTEETKENLIAEIEKAYAKQQEITLNLLKTKWSLEVVEVVDIVTEEEVEEEVDIEDAID